jgi:flavin reductase (DIM6/NTAB) family NADH-FMN oxidoreductase RutF
MKTIEPRELSLSPVRQLLDDWMLLTSGDFSAETFNAMTVAWGFIGAMWRRPVMITPVRSTRYTRQFMEQHDTWTLCAFPEAHREDLQLLGSRSGRDGNKIADTALTPIASTVAAAPSWRQSILTIECRTIYYNDIEPQRMVDPSLDTLYNNDYHRMYYGEILAVHVADVT